MLPERLHVVGARNQMNKQIQIMITIIFLSWAFVLLIVKNNYSTRDYITPEEESTLTFIR